MIRIVYCLCAFLILSNANAKDVSGFYKRFEISQNTNGETVINDKLLLENVSVTNFINYLKDVFENKKFIPLDDEPFTCAAQVYDKKNAGMYKALKKTIELLSKFKFDLIVTSPGFQKFLVKFETEFNEFIVNEEVQSLANLDNAKYFYTKNSQGYIIEKIKDFIKDAIDVPGGIEFALFFGDAYESYVLQKRAYHQNILLAYLIEFSASELGLTDLQVAQAKSSVFESRISVNGYFSAKKESKKAQENWLGYGQEKINSMRMAAEEHWRKNEKEFNAEVSRLEIFSLALFNNSPIYVNLSQKKGMFSSKSALTFDPNCPDYVYIKRYGYGLVRIGMEVMGIPFSKAIDKLLIEQYQKHIPSEGLLYGLFEIRQSSHADDIAHQAMNPFIKVNEEIN